MPKISVITVCYNSKDMIKETVDSVLAQDFSDFEYIVIDGASKDGTTEILREYGDKIRLISEPDKGIYEAMNKGVRQANGEYVMFLNAGDHFASPTVLSEVFAGNPDADIVFGDFIFEYPDGRQEVQNYEGVQINTKYLVEYFLPHTSSFTKKELLEKYGYFDEGFRIAGDYEFFLRVVNKHDVSIQHVPTVVSVYNLEGISGDPKNHALQAEERRRAQQSTLTKLQYIRYVIGISAWIKSKLKVAYYLGMKPFIFSLYLLLRLSLVGRKPNKNKILLISEHDAFGGVRTYLKQLLALYSDQGLEVTLLGEEYQLDEEIRELLSQYGFKSMVIPSRKQFFPLIQRFGAMHALLYDVWIINKTFVSENPALIVLSVSTQGLFTRTILYPINWLYILHTYPHERMKVIDEWLLNVFLGPKKIIATVSEFSRDRLRGLWLWQNNHKYVEVVYNMSGLSEELLRKRTDSKVRVLTVAHVDDWKDPLLWIEVAKATVARLGKEKVEFVWAGGGDMLDECREICADASSIEFVGYQDPAHVAQLFADSDVYLQTSKMESFGISVVDAMRMSTPVVVTEVGGLPEIVEQGKTGYVISPKNPEEISAKIVELVRSPELRQKLGKAGRVLFEEKFSQDSWKQHMIDLHQKLSN